MKLFFRIIFKIFLILTILIGCATTQEIKEDAEAYYNRGLAYANQGQHDLACSDWKKSCELGACKAYELAKRRGLCK
jgi:hypothetical protein